MRTGRLSLVAALVCLSAPAWGDDVSGAWTATVDSPMGAVDLLFEFAADGAALTGTVAAGGMPLGSITDGKVEGSDVAFKLPMMGFDGGPGFTITYEGTVSGDELKLVSTVPGGPGGEPMVTELTAKRAQ